MLLKKRQFLFLYFAFLAYQAFPQCNALRPQRDITFNTDQECAPVTVTNFQITYYFNVPQDPATIQIMYEWNDPLNTIDVISSISGLVAGAGNTSFTANSSFIYNDNDGQCNIRPTTYIVINGVACPSSRQQQTAFFWGTDQQANARLDLAPPNWNVCYDNPVINAVFEDASEFNCNIVVEPDNPNQAARHVQFVYGTNHNALATIRNLTLNDGGTQGLTDGSGNRANTIVRGSGAVTVTGAYFGPVETVPFPANGPAAVTFPMNAPADVANAVGNRFEITLYNWNICNPWNGDAVNPNYEDAILTHGYIVIVNAPSPQYETRDLANVLTTDFCIGETIKFKNLTPNLNSYTYKWEFYDDAIGTSLINTSTQTNPSYAYNTGGTKLIRLTAENTTAQSSCVETYSATVNITPSVVANITTTDLTDQVIVPEFCQEGSSPFTTFDVRFKDTSTGTVTANTEWQWKFFNELNVLILQVPAVGYTPTQPGDIDRQFTSAGLYRAELRIRDKVTLCETSYATEVKVYNKALVDFTVARVCEGQSVAFQDNTTLSSIDGQQIISREWDFHYDGVNFQKEAAYDNQQSFNYLYSSDGIYQVALRVTTDKGTCSAMVVKSVTVDPLPNASFIADKNSGCSTLSVQFTNQSIIGQPDVIESYQWEINDGSGFQIVSMQDPLAPDFSATFNYDFINTGIVDKIYQIRLRVKTTHQCEVVSPPLDVTVFPAPRAGFVSLNYSPFNDNCSPVTVNFSVDAQTQSLNPTGYIWTVSDASGIISQESSGTTPSYQYVFNNSTQAIHDFDITLQAMLPSTCYGDSTRTIRINPTPSSEFNIETPLFDCKKMVIHPAATQKGLAEYAWTISINGTVVFSDNTVGEEIDYEIMRNATINQSVDVSLVTKNFAGCESSLTTHTVIVPKNNAINAAFNATPLLQTLPDATVALENTSTQGAFQYSWDFGDGQTADGYSISSHTYETYGTYSITLSVTDGICVVTHVVSVKINPIPPILDFDYYPGEGCAPLTVNFINKSKYADPASYVWHFGVNQGTSRAINPSYTYFQPGVYSVTLSATNILGDTVKKTKEMIIQIYESPHAQFNIYPREISVPGDILYTSNESSGATSYLWDFGDGQTATDVEPKHTYQDEGVFDITLIATSAYGCTDTTKILSAVKTVNSGKLRIPNAFRPNQSGPGSTNALGNEMFIPLMRNVSKFNLMVFNRWGELLFESSNQEQGWDGYYKGKLCQQDVYIYKITVEYEDGKQMTKTGDINLIR